jgi:hypothetical protein
MTKVALYSIFWEFCLIEREAIKHNVTEIITQYPRILVAIKSIKDSNWRAHTITGNPEEIVASLYREEEEDEIMAKAIEICLNAINQALHHDSLASEVDSRVLKIKENNLSSLTFKSLTFKLSSRKHSLQRNCIKIHRYRLVTYRKNTNVQYYS